MLQISDKSKCVVISCVSESVLHKSPHSPIDIAVEADRLTNTKAGNFERN